MTVARARTTDPQTSHEAAHFIEVTAAPSQRVRALGWVKVYPGLTCSEYAAAMELDRAALSKRLPELERDGLIRKGTPKLGLGKVKESTWWPVETEQQGRLI